VTTEIARDGAGVSPRPLRFLLQVPVGPEWRNIELLRSAVLNCLAAVFDDLEFGKLVAMVTSELMENAIKYGEWSRAEASHLMVIVRGMNGSVEIDVANPVPRGSPKVAALEAMIRAIDSYPSPREAYLARLLTISERPTGSSVSKLGLARIAYEGRCRLEVRMDDAAEMLHVVATVETRP